MIRRLERLRKFGKTGWQNGNPFEKELHGVEEAEQATEAIGRGLLAAIRNAYRQQHE